VYLDPDESGIDHQQYDIGPAQIDEVGDALDLMSETSRWMNPTSSMAAPSVDRR
jgi:hypothetical protein